MEGNGSVYQVNPVGRITGEGRAEFLRTWGRDFDQKGGGRGRGGGGDGWGRSICAWKLYRLFFGHLKCAQVLDDQV